MIILGIDPGEKNIGVAISDPSATISRPLTIIPHLSRQIDAARIVEIAVNHNVGKIIVGYSQTTEGVPSHQGRKSIRLGEAVRDKASIPVVFFEENDSTKRAQEIRREMGVKKKKRSGHLDDFAASIILQEYLDRLK